MNGGARAAVDTEYRHGGIEAGSASRLSPVPLSPNSARSAASTVDKTFWVASQEVVLASVTLGLCSIAFERRVDADSKINVLALHGSSGAAENVVGRSGELDT
jgi:hypothetical protein